MNDGNRFKELMARLVAMSPEPPPYPEEMEVKSNETSTRPRPALVFLGAAVVVLALGIPLLLINGGNGVVAGDSTTTTSTVPDGSTSQVPASSTTTTIIETTTTVATSTTEDTTGTTIAVDPEWESVMYLTHQPENSNTGNPAVVPIRARVTDPTGDIQGDSYLTDVLTRIDPEALPAGLGNIIPESVRILDVTTDEVSGEPVWVADMNESFLDGAGGLLADLTMLNQLVYTITQDTPEIEGVLFTVNGEPVDAFGSEGLGLTDPVGRDDFLDQLNPIFLTEPILEGDNGYVVAGRANTFEASLTVQVVDGDGQVVHEEPVQATCGTGCWGEFGVEVSSELIVPGESSIRLLTYSAEDGSSTNVVTVPIPLGGVWDFTVDG